MIFIAVYLAAATALVGMYAYGASASGQSRRFTATIAAAVLVVLGATPWLGIFTAAGLHWEIESLMAFLGIPCVILGLSGIIVATAVRLKQSDSTENY